MTTAMKGPSPEAVYHVISILFESLNANNEADFATDFPLPEDACVECAQHYIKATNVIHDAFLRGLNDRTVHRYRNSQLPIGRLPVELLVKIFGLSTTSGWGKTRWIQSLSSVCARWQSIIIATPHFWTNINVQDGAIVKHQLERSESLPLSIKLQNSDDYPLPEPFIWNFERMIEEEAHRLRVLEVDTTYEDWGFIESCMAEPMPLLEKAELSVCDEEEHDLPLKFVGGSKLSYLRLSNVVLEIAHDDKVQWPLTRLHMDLIWPSSSFLLQILRRCPDLVKLVIHRASPSEYSDGWPKHPTLITLPHLQVLELSECDSTVSELLVRCIVARNIKRFHVKEENRHSDATLALALLARPSANRNRNRTTLLQSMLLGFAFGSIGIDFGADVFTLVGTAEPDKTSITPPHKKWGLKLRFNDPKPSSLDDILRHIHFPNVPTHVKIMSPHHKPRALYSIPSATSIILRGKMDFIEDCVALLRNPDEGTGCMVCPVLLELHLDVRTLDGEAPDDALEANGSLMEDIQRLVRARRMVQDMAPSDGGQIRVTCNAKGGKHRCFFSESEGGGRFVDEGAT